MALIRNMVAQDLPYVYDIALKTAFAGLDGTPYYYDKWAVGHYYAAPYFFFEPEVCFTALNDQEYRPASLSEPVIRDHSTDGCRMSGSFL